VEKQSCIRRLKAKETRYIPHGKPLVTDGMFAETCEPLGGYSRIDANDFADAIRIAARIPGARVGTVEIRPVMEIAGRPMRVRDGPMP
jgi:hypothetical protein